MVKRLISVKKQAQDALRPTRDTFQNFAAKTGIGTQNLSSGNTYGFNPISRIHTLLEWMYRGSWIVGVAVDCVADDMTREGVTLSTTLKPEETEKLQSAQRRLQIWQSLNMVAKWARLYGGAVGFIDIEGQDPETPLRLETIEKDQFNGITPMDMWMLVPDLTRAVKRAGPDFGLPEFYTVIATSFNFPMAQKKIHYSRLIRMEGIELPFWQKQTENMWGISIIERVFDRITAFDSTTQGAAQLSFRAYLRTYKVKGLRQIIAAGGPSFQALTQQIELTRLYQSNEGLTLMDGEDEFEGHQYAFGGLADVMDRMAEQLSGATQIPLARLFGQSPSGLNATGDHDLRTYYDNVKRQQERWFRRPMDVVLRCLAANEDIELPEGFEYEFASLWQMTDDEKAKTNVDDTASVMSAQSGGLISPATALKELRTSGRVTGRWTNISDQDIADAEDADFVPGAPVGGDEESEGLLEEGEKLKDKPDQVKPTTKDAAPEDDLGEFGGLIHLKDFMRKSAAE